MLKLLTAPVWVVPYAVGKLFRARAVVRSGRRTQPVRVVRTPVLVLRTRSSYGSTWSAFPRVPMSPDVSVPPCGAIRGERAGGTRQVQRMPDQHYRWSDVERTTGFEPATPTLARWCSTN